jgi:exopolysaccharide biosynthesis polyprenyl glycosylphosphotransferase
VSEEENAEGSFYGSPKTRRHYICFISEGTGSVEGKRTTREVMSPFSINKNGRYRRFMVAIRLTLDGTLLVVSLITTYYIEEVLFGTKYYFAIEGGLRRCLFTAVVYSLVSLLIFAERKLYGRQLSTARLDELYSILVSLIAAGFVMIALRAFFPDAFVYPPFVVLGNLALSFLLVGSWRIILRRFVGRLASMGFGIKNLLVYGAGPRGRKLVQSIKADGCTGFHVVGYADDDPGEKGRFYEGCEVIGGYEDMDRIIGDNDVDEVLLALPPGSRDRVAELAYGLKEKRMPFTILADTYGLVTREVTAEQVGSVPLIRVWREPLDGWQGYVKRTVDFTLAALGVAILCPIWLVIGLLIKFDSKGPVFYKQARLTKNMKPFNIFKFRSMRENAEDDLADLLDKNEMDGPIFKVKEDPRMTKIGRFLRRFSIDELPQLINVIRGELSLVGPRPPIPSEVDQYEPWQMKRLAAPQGITGLWQVSGRNLLTFEEMVNLDIYYIENWSLWTDIKILLKTIPVVLLRRGAY